MDIQGRMYQITPYRLHATGNLPAKFVDLATLDKYSFVGCGLEKNRVIGQTRRVSALWLGMRQSVNNTA